MTTYIPSLTLPTFCFEKPAAAVLFPIALGQAVGLSTRPDKSKQTYNALKQPPYAPDPKIFAPVWTVLYGSMGYAAYRAWSVGLSPLSSPEQILSMKHGATLYTIQLGLNLIWMPLFFTLGRPIEATVDIVALTGITGYLTYTWGKVDSVAAWALAPYLGWLGFATYLCVSAEQRSRWRIGKVLTWKD